MVRAPAGRHASRPPYCALRHSGAPREADAQSRGEREGAITSRRTAGERPWGPPLSVGPARRAGRFPRPGPVQGCKRARRPLGGRRRPANLPAGKLPRQRSGAGAMATQVPQRRVAKGSASGPQTARRSVRGRPVGFAMATPPLVPPARPTPGSLSELGAIPTAKDRAAANA